MNKKTPTLLILSIFTMLFTACSEETPSIQTNTINSKTTCDISEIKNNFKLTAPTDNAIIFGTKKFVISLGNKDASVKNISRIDYFSDNKKIASSDTYPFSIDIDTTKNFPNGIHSVQAKLYDNCNNQITSQVNSVLSYADAFNNAKEYHVAVDGTAQGDGSIEKPWDVVSAFGGYLGGKAVYTNIINPGDTIWIHGGDYNGEQESTVYKSHLTGTKEKPIIIRAYGDGISNIHITGQSEFKGKELSQYNWYWGLEPHINREERTRGDSFNRPYGISLHREGQRIINMVISNNGHPGIGTWLGVGEDGHIYGSIVWGNGVYDKHANGEQWPRGSGLYGQTDQGNRLFKDNVFFRNFTFGLKLYGQQATIKGAIVEGNIAFKSYVNPIRITTTNYSMENISLTNNYTYADETEGRGGVAIGDDIINSGLIVKGNYFVDGKSQGGALGVSAFDNVEISNNTIITTATKDNALKPRLFTYKPTFKPTNIKWNNNSYYGGRDSSLNDDNIINNILADGTPAYFWSETQWLEEFKPFDKDSTFSRNYPTQNMIVVRPNLYERGRGHIAIYNWQGLSTVDVDVSDLGLSDGEAYEVRDIQNYYGTQRADNNSYGKPLMSGVYSQENPILTLPMNLTKISPIIGNITHMKENLSHTSSRFGIFIVLKK